MLATNQLPNQPRTMMTGELLQKVVLENDLAALSPIQKVEYVKNLCESLNLNLVTKPIQLLKFQGKEVPYFTKAASEQLRKNNRVSISKVDTNLHPGGLYVVTAYATTPDGRQDCSTAAICIENLKGDALANALMKAETKAKRRVTLSICGLGFMDELEAETIPNAKKIDISDLQQSTVIPIKQDKLEDHTFEYSKVMTEIKNAKDMEELKIAFESAKNIRSMLPEEFFVELVFAKDTRKEELQNIEEEIEVDTNTGEIFE